MEDGCDGVMRCHASRKASAVVICVLIVTVRYAMRDENIVELVTIGLRKPGGFRKQMLRAFFNSRSMRANIQ